MQLINQKFPYFSSFQLLLDCIYHITSIEHDRRQCVRPLPGNKISQKVVMISTLTYHVDNRKLFIWRVSIHEFTYTTRCTLICMYHKQVQSNIESKRMSPPNQHFTHMLLGPMSGENRLLVTDGPVEVGDLRRITDHFRGMYRIPQMNKSKPRRC